ncbi:MAG: spermidine/putrescine ABC transporter substrate-binding protein [Oscillospiraceae bacterium]|jgi:spermidine/putrescine transport system substrate-binding protein|nr:spermidine/putrescine ABC transporter substrate-binding protein [Oscillospiraceae bacterium]
MKKVLTVLLALTLILGVFSGCGGESGSDKNEVNVYNWGEYIDMSLLDEFEEETGIKVNYNTYENNEQMYSVLKQGGVSYDVVIPSDYMVARMIDEDMLEPLAFENVTNFVFIEDSLKNMAYDPDNTYSIPYMWGTVGIIYDPNVVGEVTSWSALFDPANTGKTLMFDNSRDAFGIALKYLGYSLNTTNETELNEAYELLEQQKPILQGYVMDQIFDKLESGEAAIGPYYAGDYFLMLENNPDLKFCIPTEGTNVFVDAMCVLKGAENKENAEKFINFMSRADVSRRNSEFIGYTSPNSEAKELLDVDEYQLSVMYPSDELLANCEAFANLPQATLDWYSDAWARLKS